MSGSTSLSRRALCLGSITAAFAVAGVNSAYAATSAAPQGTTDRDALADALSNADRLLIGQKIQDLAKEVESTFLVSAAMGGAKGAFASLSATPGQAGLTLSKAFGLGTAVVAGISADAQGKARDRRSLEKNGQMIESSSQQLKSVVVTGISGSKVQVTVKIHAKRYIAGDGIPWEEVVPYVLTFDTKTKTFSDLRAVDGLLEATPEDQSRIVTVASSATTANGAVFGSGSVHAEPAVFSASGGFAAQNVAIGSSGKEAAARYADKYWDNYNPGYESYGNDCTNFLSQCFRAGGWGDNYNSSPTVNGWPPTWWHSQPGTSRPTSSQSWRVAEDFYGVNTWNLKRLYNTQDRYALRRGDTLFWKRPNATVIGHAMIVTGYSSQYREPLLTYHTSDNYNTRLSTVVDRLGGPNSGYTWFPMGVY